MKKIFSVAAIFGTAFLFVSAVMFTDVPQDPPKKKVKKHINVVQVEDGEKVELDTVLETDEVFVWMGDTIGGSKTLKWISKDDVNLDSLHQHFDMDFEYEIEKDDNGHVFILKSGKGLKDVGPVEIHADSIRYVISNSDKKGNRFIVRGGNNDELFLTAPNVAGVPPRIHTPGALLFDKTQSGNVIDLSDPGVISYKKKKLKDGREKITIIRNEVEDENKEIREEIIIHGDQPVMWHAKTPGKSKKVKIIKEDDGKVEIIEDEDVWTVKEGEERVKVIEKDGNVIHIREINKDGEKKVEVKVEVEEKENKKQ